MLGCMWQQMRKMLSRLFPCRAGCGRDVPALMLGLAVLLTIAPAQAAGESARPPSPAAHPIIGNAGNDRTGQPEGARQRADLLDGLFARLYLAEDEKTAALVADSIRKLLAEPESASAKVLMMQAERALKAGQTGIARHLLDLVTARWPNFAEGWYRRGLARFLEDDLEGALADLNRALASEPRHFEALMTKAAILQELKRPKEAKAAYERVLAIYPLLPAARDALKALRARLDQQI